MVEVDPMILIAVGSIAAGLAATVLCLRVPFSSTEKPVTASKVEHESAPKPKKKSTKSAKKSTSSSNVDVPQTEESEIAAIMADLGPTEVQQKPTKKQKEVTKSNAPSAADLAAAAARKVADIEEAARQAEIEKVEAQAEIAAALADRLLAEEEEKKNKKPKESAVQKTARLERQKIAKLKKTEEEEMSKSVAIELATAESKSAAAVVQTHASVAPVHADGWAVVENQRKVKAKAVVAAAPSWPTEGEASDSGEPVVPADFVKSEVTVEQKKVGSIIGPKGATLHGIQDACGVEINTPKGDKDSTAPVVVSVSGPAEGVAKAIQAINDLCTKGFTNLLAGDDFIKSEVTVDQKKIGSIIGPRGVTLHSIQDACGVEINTPKGEKDGSSPVIITISGPVEGVAKATQAIQDLVAKGYSKLLAGEDFKEGSIEVHPTYVSEIIGKGGANIRAIQDFTGVKLSIPQVARDHVVPVKISIAGNKDKVQVAKDIIVELTKYFHTSVTHPGQVHQEMDVPSALYNHIIGARGSEIKHIQANFSVNVHIPNVDTVNKMVVIVGDLVGVKGAEKYIQKIIDQAIADKEHAEKMADSWVDAESEAEASGHEGWMDAYTHPSRGLNGDALLTSSESSTGPNDDYTGGLKSGAASTASAAASASAWGASILTSSDGW